MVSRATTSSEVWETLALTYSKPSRGHVKQLKTQLKNWRRDTKTIDAYIQGITTRLDQLAILGKAVEHEDQIDLILDVLTEDYKSVIDQVEGRDTPPTITELHERLFNHEAKLLSAADSAVSPHLPINANVAQQHRSHSNNCKKQSKQRQLLQQLAADITVQLAAIAEQGRLAWSKTISWTVSDLWSTRTWCKTVSKAVEFSTNHHCLSTTNPIHTMAAKSKYCRQFTLLSQQLAPQQWRDTPHDVRPTQSITTSAVSWSRRCDHS
ncbi:unnamed protein product [Microthlaspi erraticum]|uniref:Uncharacterized protein n=1 Tax=Microthlaspi erraticum TaxID=1685480 RepID=A0A6D2J0F8_9BRAS|nr:unnamed protein product [Microthlaspi erraticum]